MKEKQTKEKTKDKLLKEWTDVSFACMLLVIYFSVTLFLVECLNKFRGINTKMYLIILFVSIIWIFSFGINIISACIMKDGKRKNKR